MIKIGDFLGFVVSMLAITNPAGSLAVFLGMTNDKTESEKKKIALTTTLTILIVLLLILLLGLSILKVFGISLPAFQITGGLIILLRGLDMLHFEENPISQSANELNFQSKTVKASIAVVPLGIPIIAGPGAMTNVIIFSRHFSHFSDKIMICGGIFLVSFIVGGTLFFATYIGKIIGDTGIKITTRIMGLLLAAIAMSMIMNGLSELFPGWN